MLRQVSIMSAMLCVLLLSTQSVLAQAGGGRAGGRGVAGAARGGAGFNPAALQQRQLDNIKTALASSDDEWKILQPKVEKVMSAELAALAGGRGAGRRNRGAAAGGTTPSSAVAMALADLQNVLTNTSAPPQLIAQKLAALRDARAKAAADLTAARKDLKGVLTARQEAVMVTMGYLE